MEVNYGYDKSSKLLFCFMKLIDYFIQNLIKLCFSNFLLYIL